MKLWTFIASRMHSKGGNEMRKLRGFRSLMVVMTALALGLTVLMLTAVFAQPVFADGGDCPECRAGVPQLALADCGECDGKVTRLTLRYNGTEDDVLIQVYEGDKQEADKLLHEASNVSQGYEFTFDGIKDDGTMGSEISVWVNGQLNAEIHTSCSKPIGPGLVKGDFEVVEGYSKNGGKLCPLPGSIGDYVWWDVDVDGVQDADETGIADVTVNLYDSTNTLIRTTQTAPSGYYIFTNLPAGSYYVEFEQPAGYDFTLQDQGSDDTLDSDADPITRKTATITLGSEEIDLTWDAGLHLCDIGDRVWYDVSGEGVQGTKPSPPFPAGEPEPGFNDVDVYLYNSNPGTSCGSGSPLAKTTTISGTSQTPVGWPDGIYGFDMGSLGLGTDTYWVCVDESTLPYQPYGWDLTTGSSNPRMVSYTTGTDDFSIDFGYEPGAPPTVVTISSFAANSNTGGSVNPLWPGLAGTVLAAGSLFWVKRRD